MIDDYLIEMRKQEAVRLKTLNRLISKYTPIHIINIVNIMHKYRFCENGSAASLKDIEEYSNKNNINVDILDMDTLSIIISWFYPNKYKKVYHYTHYGDAIEVKLSISLDTDNNYRLGYNVEPNIVFEVSDFTISDNYETYNFTNEFILHNTLNSDPDKTLLNFRIEVEKSMSNIDNRVTKLDYFLYNKFGHKYVFNGWISDLTAVISKV